MPTAVRYANLVPGQPLIKCTYACHPHYTEHTGSAMAKAVEDGLTGLLGEDVLREGLIGGTFDGAITITEVSV